MKKLFGAVAGLAAAGGIGYLVMQDGSAPTNTQTADVQTEQTETVAPRPSAPREAPPTINYDELRKEIRAAVEFTSVTAAYDNPQLAAALNAAQDIAGDDLDNNAFMTATYTITTRHGMVREVDTVAYCSEFVGNRNYLNECAESIGWKLAATNSAYKGPLESHVPTDNPALREHALSSLRWLRTATEGIGTNDNYYVVQDIRDMASTTGLSADAFIPAPEGEEEFADKKERILSAVVTRSVTPAMSDPDTYEELTNAQEVVQDGLRPEGFLNMSFHVATPQGTLENMEVLAYCEEFIGDRDYNDACAERIRMKVAATNSTSAFGLAAHVPTDNRMIRENALVSVEWLRRALDNTGMDNSYYVVRELNTLTGPK